jgi:hypothetical protein
MLIKAFSVDAAIRRALLKLVERVAEAPGIRVNAIAEEANWSPGTVLRRLKSVELADALREDGLCLKLPASRANMSGRSLVTLEPC